MAGIDFTTDGLVNELKVRGTIPTSQSLFLSADLVTLMNSQMHSKVIPAILKVHEDYFVTTTDTSLVANQAAYSIPSRAIAGRLRDICLVDANGTEIELPLGRTEDNKGPRPLFQFYFQAHQIVLVPTPTAVNGMSVRFKYERRPNNLCVTSLSGAITAINTGTNVVTLTRRPTAWDTTTLLDVTNQNPPFNPIADDQVITAVSGLTVTFSSLPSGLAVGQYVAESGLSPIPQMPYEAALVIAEFGGAVARCSLKNKAPVDADMLEAQRQLDQFLAEINPRVTGEAKRVVSQNGGIFSASGYGEYGYRANVGP